MAERSKGRKQTKSNQTNVAKWIMQNTIFMLPRASRRIKRSAFGLEAEGPVRKVSYILPHKLAGNGNPSMHSLRIRGGKGGQRRVSVLELVPNTGI